jgi:hypothetical protein
VFTTQILLHKTTVEDAVNGQYQQVLLGRPLKFGVVAVLVLEFVVVSRDGPAVQVLMADVLLKPVKASSLQSVRQVQLVVTQDVIHAKDFQVMFVDQTDFVCVHQAVQKRLLNVFGVKTVHTADVKCLTADVLMEQL